MIVLENVSYTYSDKSRKTDALRGVSYTFEEGRLYAIMGVSGSGKSTLLSLIAGLRTPTVGRVLIDGEDTAEIDACRLRRDKISVIYQELNLFPLLTAEENAAYPLTIKRTPRKEAEKRARACLERVELKPELFGALPKKLSGGEQQRAAIARTLAAGSKIVLADEPTGSLDKKNGDNIVEILQRLAHEEKACVIVVTHDPSVDQRADETLTIVDGTIEEKQ